MSHRINNKEESKEKVLLYLNDVQGATETELSNELGIHFYLLSDIVKELKSENKISSVKTKHVTVYMSNKDQNGNSTS